VHTELRYRPENEQRRPGEWAPLRW